MALLALALLTYPSPSWSHPHVFMYNHVNVVFDEKGLAGFRIRWQFDEMFSSMIILDFDRNHNKRFEPSEVEEVRKGAFSNLHEFEYFTHISIDGKRFRVAYVTDFSAEIIQDNLVYQFFVPCHVSAADAFKNITLSVYDDTFYCSIFLERDPVSYEKGNSCEIEHRIQKNRDDAYYFGQIYPEEISLRFRKNHG